MKNRVLGFALIALLGVGALTSCEKKIKTPLTDSLKLEAEVIEGAKFTEPSDGIHAIGEVTICEVVDGDTFNFHNGKNVDSKTTSDVSYTVRFEGVNTPESTAMIEPWGVKASQFVKNILWDHDNAKQKPVSVVIQNDVSAFGQTDQNDRYLGFIWYKMTEKSSYRLLNLELIEQCYSKNLLSNYSDFCPYYDYFVEAQRVAMKSGRRIFGEDDPGYDYKNTVLDVSIKYIRENYQLLGVSDTDSLESSSSGVKLRVKALILGFSGNNTFIRDIADPMANGEYASIYVFTSLTVSTMSQMFGVGQIIQFTAKATKYHNNVQLTDVTHIEATTVEDDQIHVLFEPKQHGISAKTDWQDEAKYSAVKSAAEALGYHYDLLPYDKVTEINEIKNSSELETYLGAYIKVKLTCRAGDVTDPNPTGEETVESHYRYDSDGYDLTILTKTDGGVKLDVRSLKYGSGYIKESLFKVGSSYIVVGQLAKYYDGYQIVVPNRFMGSPIASYVTAL